MFGGGTGRVWRLEKGECLGKSEMRGGGPAAPLCILEALGSPPALGQLWAGPGFVQAVFRVYKDCHICNYFSRLPSFVSSPSSSGSICSVQVSRCLSKLPYRYRLEDEGKFRLTKGRRKRTGVHNLEERVALFGL